jgi:hypothetical protein
MRRGGVPIFLGPQQEAEQVQAVLQAQGLSAELILHGGGWQPWGGATPYDARVMVPVEQVPRARQLLRRNPRWKPVDEKADLAETETRYRVFVIAAAVVLVAGAAAIAAILIYGR